MGKTIVGTEIRRAVAADYEAACDLLDDVDALHRENLPHIFKRPNGSIRERDYFLGLINEENVGLFVAEVGGMLVDLVHSIIKDTPAIPIFVPRRYAVVGNITVRPLYQNRGIGRLLMERTHE